MQVRRDGTPHLASAALSRRKSHLPPAAAHTLPRAAQGTTHQRLGARAPCWLLLRLASSWVLRTFCSTLLSSSFAKLLWLMSLNQRVPGCFVSVLVPPTVRPTLFLHVSQCHCCVDEETTCPPAKAVVQVERSSCYGRGRKSLVIESRAGLFLISRLLTPFCSSSHDVVLIKDDT